MPNVTWQEPQLLIDVLAINLLAGENGMKLPGTREVVVISPWLSDVEIFMRPGPWHQHLMVGEAESSRGLGRLLVRFCQQGWAVHVAVLAYGANASGLRKDPQQHLHERQLLRTLLEQGANVYLVPNLHAKGIVTPLAIITGSTNLTNSGLYLQAQNANYFAHDHPDYAANRLQLKARFQGATPVTAIPDG